MVVPRSTVSPVVRKSIPHPHLVLIGGVADSDGPASGAEVILTHLDVQPYSAADALTLSGPKAKVTP